MRRGLVTLLCLGVAGQAAAAPPALLKDQLTISGRFELPRATVAPLKSGLSVADVKVAPDWAEAFKGKPDTVSPIVRQSFEASLRNFGYLADGQAAPVTLTIEPLQVTKEAAATTVVTRLTFAASGESEAARCLPASTQAKFKALAPLKSGDGQRAAGVLTMVAFAAVGVNAGQLMMSQFDAAKANNRALNARRVVAEGEGVSFSAKEADMLRFAASNATQLALADFIAQLGDSPCGKPEPAAEVAAASEPVVEPAAAEAPPEPAPPAQSAPPAT